MKIKPAHSAESGLTISAQNEMQSKEVSIGWILKVGSTFLVRCSSYHRTKLLADGPVRARFD